MHLSWLQRVVALAVLVVLPVAGRAQTNESRMACPEQLVGLRSTIWTTLEIPVCWEASAPADGQERAWVRSAVQATWEKHSALRLTGWEGCTASSRGIRMGSADINPHTKGMGNQLDGQPEGMMHNLTFEAWSPNCRQRREECIRTIAVHEFGHALGFAHEQNRSDAPDWCQAETQGPSGDINITPYDLHSVMNYCNPKWIGNGQLSAEDIAGLQAWYGRPQAATARFDGTWQATLTYSDRTCVADAVSLTVRGAQVQGRVQTPAGQVVEIAATIDQEAGLQGLQFRLTPRDLVTLRGRLTGGMVHSTDCGCGQYTFIKQ